VRLDVKLVEPDIAVRYELSRILHEALANVERHADARNVAVTLTQAGDRARLVVADDGRGMPREPGGPHPASFGIVGMSERAKAIGGTLRVASAGRVGTQVLATVPIRLSTEGDMAVTGGFAGGGLD
jgi:signal transduction histidine kinase